MDDMQRYFDKIKRLKCRIPTGSFDALTEQQRRLYEVIKRIANSDEEKVIRRRDIENEGTPDFSREKPLNIRLTDFCYNKVNLDDNDNKFLLSVGRGEVLYVDFGWSNEQEEEITWKLEEVPELFVVGTYHSRKFDWKFDDLEQYLLGAKQAVNGLAND